MQPRPTPSIRNNFYQSFPFHSFSANPSHALDIRHSFKMVAFSKVAVAAMSAPNKKSQRASTFARPENQYVREILHAPEPAPPITVRFFYTSPLAIDDPLSPLPPPVTGSGNLSKAPPRAFSDGRGALCSPDAPIPRAFGLPMEHRSPR